MPPQPFARVLHVIGDLGGCGFYRALSPGWELQRRGHIVNFARSFGAPPMFPHLHKSDDPDLTMLDRVRIANVVIFQRQTDPAILKFWRTAKQRFPHLRSVVEFDDNFHDVPAFNPGANVFGHGKEATLGLEQFIAEADAVIVSTEDLRDQYAHLHDNIHVCKNAILDKWAYKMLPANLSGLPKVPGQIRIGWAGTFTHSEDVKTAVPALEHILTCHPHVRIVLAGDDLRKLFAPSYHHRIECDPGTGIPADFPIDAIGEGYVLPTYQWHGMLRRCNIDIGIAPLLPHRFNEAKSYVKMLEYGLAGIPSIAADFGPYKRYVAEATIQPSILLAKSTRDWVQTLETLVTNADLRRTLATNNLYNILLNHLQSKRASQWENALYSAMTVAR